MTGFHCIPNIIERIEVEGHFYPQLTYRLQAFADLIHLIHIPTSQYAKKRPYEA